MKKETPMASQTQIMVAPPPVKGKVTMVYLCKDHESEGEVRCCSCEAFMLTVSENRGATIKTS